MRFIRRTQKRNPTATVAITEKKRDNTTAVKPPLLSSPVCGDDFARAAKSMINVVLCPPNLFYGNGRWSKEEQ